MNNFPLCFELINSVDDKKMTELVMKYCRYQKISYEEFCGIYKVAQCNNWDLDDIPEKKLYEKLGFDFDCEILKSKYECGNLCLLCSMTDSNPNVNQKYEQILISFLLNHKEKIDKVSNMGLTEDNFNSLDLFSNKYAYPVLKDLFNQLITNKDISTESFPLYVKDNFENYLENILKLDPTLNEFYKAVSKLTGGKYLEAIDEQDNSLKQYQINFNNEDANNSGNVFISTSMNHNSDEKKVGNLAKKFLSKNSNSKINSQEHPEQTFFPLSEKSSKRKQNNIKTHNNLLPKKQINEEFNRAINSLIIVLKKILASNNCENISTDVTDSNLSNASYNTISSHDEFRKYFYEILAAKEIYMEYLEERKELIVYINSFDEPIAIDMEDKELVRTLSIILSEELKVKVTFNSVPLIYEMSKQNIVINNVFDIKLAYALWKWPLISQLDYTYNKVIKDLTGYKIINNNFENKIFESINKYKSIKRTFLKIHFNKKYQGIYKDELILLQLIGKSYKLDISKDNEGISLFKNSDGINYDFNQNLKNILSIKDSNKIIIKARYQNLRKHILELIDNTTDILHTTCKYNVKVNERYTVNDLVNDEMQEVIKYSLINLQMKRGILNTSLQLVYFDNESIILIMDKEEQDYIFDAINQSMVLTAKELYPQYIPQININIL